MIVGGEDHRKDIKINPEKNYNALLKYVDTVLGNDENYKIKKRWSGEILEPIDGLPLIGKISPHLFVATAFSGNGMTYAPISAGITYDLISGKKNIYAELYSPHRHMSLGQIAGKTIDYAEEFFGGAVKNFFLDTKKIKK